MGAGDEVVVALRGQENSDFRTSVDRNGRVVLPRLPPIPAAGRSFGSFRQDVDAAVKRAYVASTASTAIGRVRQISVLVSGEVNVPGQRIVTGLSSVVDALLLSGACDRAQGRTFNLGGASVISLKQLADLLVEVNGGGAYTVSEYPADRKRIDIGDYYADFSRIRSTLGWEPRVGLREGLALTLSYYREYLGQYL